MSLAVLCPRDVARVDSRDRAALATALATGTPVVVENTPAWRGRPLTYRRLAEEFGQVPLSELRTAGGATSIGYDPSRTAVRTVGEFADAVLSPKRFAEDLRSADFSDTRTTHFALGTAERPDGLPYLANIGLRRSFPSLADEFVEAATLPRNLLRLLDTSRGLSEGELFLAPGGTTYASLHFDQLLLFVYSYQVEGRKRWWLAPPSATLHLRPIALPNSWFRTVSTATPLTPDFEKFPTLADVDWSAVTLGPGDLLCCPPGWWHFTHNVEANISVAVRGLTKHNAIRTIADHAARSILAAQLGAYEAFRLRIAEPRRGRGAA